MDKFFILGSQRSGTTLMRLILDSHPKIHCFGEIKSYPIFENKTDYTKHEDVTSDVELYGFQTPIWTELFIDYPSFEPLAKYSKIIFMVRDPKDVVASMIDMGPKFLKREIDNNLHTWIGDENRSLKKKFGKEFLEADKIKDEQDRIVQLAAIYWKYKTTTLLEMKENNLDVLKVVYEKLVLNPKHELEKVCEFLGIDWDVNLLHHHETNHTETRNKMTLGRTRADRPIDSNSIKHWEKTLTEEQVHQLINSVGELDNCIIRQ